MIYQHQYELSFSLDDVSMERAVWMLGVRFCFITHGCPRLFLNNRASVAVFVESVEKRLEIPSIESAIEHRLELRFRWVASKVSTIMEMV